MKEQEKTAPMNESGAEMSDLYNGKVSDYLAHDQDINDVFAAMRDDMLSGQEYPLRPITPQKPHQGDPEATEGEQHQAHDEMPTQATKEAETAAPPTGAYGFDFSKVDNPETPPDDVRELPIWGLPQELLKMLHMVINAVVILLLQVCLLQRRPCWENVCGACSATTLIMQHYGLRLSATRQAARPSRYLSSSIPS